MSTPLPQSLADLCQGKSILIQGEAHSFHHRAVRQLLPHNSIQPCTSFPELTQKLAENPGLAGLMAIENSVAGALLINYLLIEENHLTILGETYLRISHAVLAPAGSSIEKLESIESHPMALAQCRRFFSQHQQIAPIECFDTAGSARAVAEAGQLKRGALAPIWCAEAYGLEVLAKAVEDNPHNWTRFVLVAHAGSPLGGTKTSIAFSLPHRSGSLAAVLNILADSGVSLTKIQSLPLVGTPWQYRFFADFVHPDCHWPEEILQQVATVTTDLIHLGTYAEGKHFDS